MTKKFLYALVACSFALLAQQRAAQAQDVTDDHKFEVGAQATTIHLAPLHTLVTTPTTGTFNADGFNVTTFGVGGRVGYNVSRYVAVEAEFNYFPEKNFNEVDQSRREQFFAGVRVGKRWQKVGVFAKFRPGAMHFDELPFHTVCGASGCRQTSQTNFALDAGGVVEYYPTKRTILRFDAGDTVIYFRDTGPDVFANSTITTLRQTTHNFQASVGFGFRF
jgi:hypothetical protein